MKHSPFVRKLLIFIMAVFVGAGSIYANSFRRDKTNTSSNPGWPMNVPESEWPSGVARTQANADSINAYHQRLIAERYSWTTNGDPKYIDAIKSQNPNFGWFEYNSFQDNYVTSGDTEEHDWMVARCRSMGVNPERLYLHYHDATTMTLQGVTLTFPGVSNARTLTDTINSRVPIYYSNRSRIVVNMGDATTRQLSKEFACNMLTTLATQSGSYVAQDYIDGIFWDNTQPPFWNFGSVVSGGHVAEHPNRARVDSLGLRGTNWWWTAGMQPFFTALMDTLKTSATWSKDRQQKRIVINTSGTMYEPMATNKIAHFFGHEGGYSPLRTYTASIPEIYRWDSLSAANGVGVVYANPILTSVSGYQGSYTHHEALVSNLCLFYITSSDSSFFSPLATTGPWSFDWPTLNWCGAMDYDVGPNNMADRKYSIHTTGTDPRGYAYTVYSRTYPRAKIFLRTRGRYDQHIDAQTAVTVSLGGTYRQVMPDGSLGSAVTSTTFRNGEGKMFVLATSGGDVTPPSSVKDLSSVAGPTNGTIAVTWTSPGDDAMTGTPAYYLIKYSPNPLTATSWDAAPSLGNPPAPKAGGETVEAVLSGLDVGVRYYIGVRAVDDAGNTGGLSNEALSFSRGIQAPFLDSILVDKANQAVTLLARTVPSYLPVNYEFQVDTASSFNSAQSSVDTNAIGKARTSRTFNRLQENVKYYWRCRAVSKDGSEASDWTPLGTFIPYFGVATGEEEYQVELPGPLAGVVYETSRPVLVVENINRNGRNFYTFEIAPDSSFVELACISSPIAEAEGTTTTWQVDERLQAGVTYYWRAQANSYPFSKTASFSIRPSTYAFPNPVRIAEGEHTTFTEVPMGSRLVLVTLSGELVRAWDKTTGQDIVWDGRNQSGQQVASGTYLWYLDNSDAKGKLIVIR